MNYVKLGDLCEIKSGKRLPQNCDFADRKTQFPYIRARDIKNGRISTEDLVYIEADVQKRIKKYIIEKGDIAITIVGASVGDVGYAEECVNGYNLTENAVRLTSYNEKVYSKYLFYVLYQKQYRDYMQLIAGAAAQPKLGIYKIKHICVGLPEMSAQIKIASIISQYDALIENNNKRIKILEQMVEDLYKEWFVRFRFPNYQNAEFENGIPKGWKIKRIVDYGKIETGKTPSTMFESYYGTDIMFVKTPDMTGNIFTCQTSEYLSAEGHSQQPTKLLPANSIMVSCIGSAGVVSINSEPAHTNQQINSIILHNMLYLEWLYFTCKSLKNTIEMFGATGATMTNLSKGKFEKLKVVDPPSKIIELYHNKTASIFIKIKSLLYINQNLIKQRDMLLPRLMSGKLEVK